jgi:hypothetical protein
MTAARPMDFAGSWYPAGAETCRRAIAEFVAAAPHSPPAAPPLRLGVAPHAGWVFSGRLAARAFHALAAGGPADLVIVLGGHLHPNDPPRAMTAGAWETPFGPFTVHTGFAPELRHFPGALAETPADYVPDNSTELQLPFARLMFPGAELLALRVPPGPAALRLAQVLADYLERTGLNAAAVASTDLTHYGPNYGFEPKGRGPAALRWVREENDPAFIRALEGGGGQAVLDTARRGHCACSAGGVAVVAELARRRGLTFRPLGYATSADSPQGDTVNFVGYLAGMFA